MHKFITAGIAGHVDHGKTSLVRCLSGIDTDRLKEEKRRGLSIEPSVAPLQLPSGSRIALVDVPGHSDFLKNTIRGLSNVDAAVLVVAADDGVMPQTRDHLETLRFFQAKGGFIVLSKADLVDQETIELAEMEIREIVEGSFLEGKPVIPFSAVDNRGLDEILRAAQSETDGVAGKNLDAPFRLWVDQVRSFPGFGTVASGTILSGKLWSDATVEVLPSGKEAKVRFIEVHHERVGYAFAGQRVGVNLHAVSLQHVGLGMVLAAPGAIRPTNLLNAELSLLPTTRRPILNRQRVKLYIGTDQTTALVVLMEGERIDPGETGLVQLRLHERLAIRPRDPFVISPMSFRAVIGGGKVLETPREKFRAVKAEKTLAYLKPLNTDDVKTVISLYLEKYFSRPVTVEEICSATAFPAERIQAVIQSRTRKGKLLHLDGRGYFDRARYELLKRQVVDTTKKILSQDAFKAAATRREIRFRLDPMLDDELLEQMLGELCVDKKLARTDVGYCIPDFVVTLPSQRARLVEKLREFASDRGYVTFSPGTFKKLHGKNFLYRDIEKAINHLHSQKKLVRLNDGRFLSTEAVEQIKEKIRGFILRKGALTVLDSREIFGYGRTRAVPILDYLDSIGFTHRIGEERVLRTENPPIPKQGRM